MVTSGPAVRAGGPVPNSTETLTGTISSGSLWDPLSILYNGHRGVKRQGREADHSPPTSVEIKKTWIFASTPSYVLMA
jgi:hypothetical protein